MVLADQGFESSNINPGACSADQGCFSFTGEADSAGACTCAIRKKDGKAHCTWCPVRSVRVGKRVIQQTVAYLDELDEHGRIEARALASDRRP
ncbi:MAG: hypothetical protein J2P50_17710 [Hyphomicrobiaceae bacterium]|nr:hypothetical protein [Hyphomicrobiaceae bacterium]